MQKCLLLGGFPSGSNVEKQLVNAGDAGDTGSIHNGNSLEKEIWPIVLFLPNPIDRGSWWATVLEFAERDGHN